MWVEQIAFGIGKERQWQFFNHVEGSHGDPELGWEWWSRCPRCGTIITGIWQVGHYYLDLTGFCYRPEKSSLQQSIWPVLLNGKRTDRWLFPIQPHLHFCSSQARCDLRIEARKAKLLDSRGKPFEGADRIEQIKYITGRDGTVKEQAKWRGHKFSGVSDRLFTPLEGPTQ